MALVDSVRDFCGLTATFNTTVTEMIGQCKKDLVRVGVLESNINDEDPNIIAACQSYAAYRRDVGGKGEIYRANYEGFRDGLSLNEAYNTEAPDV